MRIVTLLATSTIFLLGFAQPRSGNNLDEKQFSTPDWNSVYGFSISRAGVDKKCELGKTWKDKFEEGLCSHQFAGLVCGKKRVVFFSSEKDCGMALLSHAIVSAYRDNQR